jgi:hypothetical protein
VDAGTGSLQPRIGAPAVGRIGEGGEEHTLTVPLTPPARTTIPGVAPLGATQPHPALLPRLSPHELIPITPQSQTTGRGNPQVRGTPTSVIVPTPRRSASTIQPPPQDPRMGMRMPSQTSGPSASGALGEDAPTPYW